MKTMILNLPYFKQGDDLSGHIKHTATLRHAFMSHATALSEAAATLETLAGYSDQVSVETADTHSIEISAEESVLAELEKKGVSLEAPYDWDEDND